MATKAGVWIDRKQAIVVLLTDAGPEIKKIAEDAGQSARLAGKARRKNFVAENTLKRRAEGDRKEYFDEVIAAVAGVESLLVLGPGEAKGEFDKHIKAKKVRGVVVELETADKMTDRQVAAKVHEHFAPTSAKKSVAPKKTAKKAAKATARKRAKKSGK